MSLGYDGQLTGMEVQVPGGGVGLGGGGGGVGGGGFPDAFDYDSAAPASNPNGAGGNFAAAAASSLQQHHNHHHHRGGNGGGMDDGALITDTETGDEGSNFTGMTTTGGNGGKAKQTATKSKANARGKTKSGQDGDKAGTVAAASSEKTTSGGTNKRKDPPADNPTHDLEEALRAEAAEQYRRAVADFEAHLETVRAATDRALEGLQRFLDVAVEAQIALVRAQHSTDGEAARIANMEPEVQAATAIMGGEGGAAAAGGGPAAALAAMMGGLGGALGGGGGMGSFGGFS